VARSRVELFEQIRRDRRLENLSIRELAERHRVHRRTVRQALPPPRKQHPPGRSPAIEPYTEIIVRGGKRSRGFGLGQRGRPRGARQAWS
jgi:hypothetical protein